MTQSKLHDRRVWTCQIDLPPKEASPNGRFHWAAKAKAIKTYREACYYLYLSAKLDGRLPFGWDRPVLIHADFYMAQRPYDHCYRPDDTDNASASLKAAQDALVDAGVLRGDSAKYVHTGEVRLHSKAKDHKGRHCVILTIEESNE